MTCRQTLSVVPFLQVDFKDMTRLRTPDGYKWLIKTMDCFTGYTWIHATKAKSEPYIKIENAAGANKHTTDLQLRKSVLTLPELEALPEDQVERVGSFKALGEIERVLGDAGLDVTDKAIIKALNGSMGQNGGTVAGDLLSAACNGFLKCNAGLQSACFVTVFESKQQDPVIHSVKP